jgi:hypothetical protein
MNKPTNLALIRGHFEPCTRSFSHLLTSHSFSPHLYLRHPVCSVTCKLFSQRLKYAFLTRWRHWRRSRMDRCLFHATILLSLTAFCSLEVSPVSSNPSEKSPREKGLHGHDTPPLSYPCTTIDPTNPSHHVFSSLAIWPTRPHEISLFGH